MVDSLMFLFCSGVRYAGEDVRFFTKSSYVEFLKELDIPGM
jgi:hypothetical protein